MPLVLLLRSVPYSSEAALFEASPHPSSTFGCLLTVGRCCVSDMAHCGFEVRAVSRCIHTDLTDVDASGFGKKHRAPQL